MNPGGGCKKPFKPIKTGCALACTLVFIFAAACGDDVSRTGTEATPAVTRTAAVLPSTERPVEAASAKPGPSPSYELTARAFCKAEVSADIRAEGAADSAVVGALPSGEEAGVIERGGKWAHILYKGLAGYVESGSLLILSPVPVPEGDWSLILVNPSHKLPEGFTVELADFGGGQVDERIRDVCDRMFADAKKAGVSLKLVDAYRSEKRQNELFRRKVDAYISKGYGRSEAEKLAATITARPNTSEHQTGLALDIVTPSYTKMNKGFAETKAFKWLDENAYNYGFTLRYGRDKTPVTKVIFEPWHWRFVGVEAAARMKISGQCLEEYLGKAD